ncbi:ABC transporter substrate-binding protein [Pseudonocardia sulfidoxydans]|uniref:ABC transporter substrate-binding protein n=1 Tax=Pseudonocardia sulfidoxydans TaxID=54011 RepID=UPI0011BE5828
MARSASDRRRRHRRVPSPRRVRIVAPVLVALVATLLAACGGGTRSQQDTGGGADAGFATGEIDRDATIRYAGTAPPTSFDPMTSQSELDMPWLAPAYDRLTAVDEAGAPVPQLATRWELSPDGKALTLQLRQGVTYSDGTPFDAASVKANLDRYRTSEKSRLKNDILMITGVDVADASTVTIRVTGSGGALLNVLASRVGMMVSPAAFANPDLDQKPVGAGAMVLTGVRPKTEYVFTRRADYWDPEAFRYKTLVFSVNDGSSVVNLLRTDALDYARLAGPAALEAEAAGIRLYRAHSISGARILLNPTRSKLGSKEVRQAISLAIDRDATSQVAFNGDCVKTVQPFPEGYFAHSATVDAEREEWGYTRNVAKAKELLARAGLPEGFEMDMLVPGVPTTQTRAVLFQQNLAEIGITVNLRVVDVIQARVLFGQGEGDSYAGDGASYTDPSVFAAQHYLTGGSSNPGNLTDPELTALIDQAAGPLDINARTALYDHVFARAFELGPVHVYLCHHALPLGYQNDVVGLDRFDGAAGSDVLRGAAKVRTT